MITVNMRAASPVLAKVAECGERDAGPRKR
jgi:hypothetical protein